MCFVLSRGSYSLATVGRWFQLNHGRLKAFHPPPRLARKALLSQPAIGTPAQSEVRAGEAHAQAVLGRPVPPVMLVLAHAQSSVKMRSMSRATNTLSMALKGSRRSTRRWFSRRLRSRSASRSEEHTSELQSH